MIKAHPATERPIAIAGPQGKDSFTGSILLGDWEIRPGGLAALKESHSASVSFTRCTIEDRPKPAARTQAPVSAGPLPKAMPRESPNDFAPLVVPNERPLHRLWIDRRGQSFDIFGHGQSAVVIRKSPAEWAGLWRPLRKG
jgi:hypothetical protein